MQPALARALAEQLAVGGRLFLQSDVKAVAQDMVAVFQAVAPELLELHESHFGEGASALWPPPEAERVNQGDDVQREAMRAASARRKRKAADALSGAAAAEGAEEGSDGEGDVEEVSGWAAMPGNGWLRYNPLGVPTERELGTVKNGGHCWRALLVRKAKAEALAS